MAMSHNFFYYGVLSLYLYSLFFKTQKTTTPSLQNSTSFKPILIVDVFAKKVTRLHTLILCLKLGSLGLSLSLSLPFSQTSNSSTQTADMMMRELFEMVRIMEIR